MNLEDYFKTLCLALGKVLGAGNTETRPLHSGKNAKNRDGVATKYDFEDFHVMLYYIEQGRHAYGSQTLWITFYFDKEPEIMFSHYDVLAYAEPENFKCYTYSYVDSPDLMKNCFSEIEELLLRLVPRFKEITENGIERNRLLANQKADINSYMGTDVFASQEMLGDKGSSIFSAIVYNYFSYGIQRGILGAQALFYEGKKEKALKELKRDKRKNQYEKNLLKFLENGGQAEKSSETVKKASRKSGTKRQTGGAKGVITFIALLLMFTVVFSAVQVPVLYLITEIISRGSIGSLGFLESIIVLPISGVFLAIFVSNIILDKIREKKQKKDKNAPQTPIYSTVHKRTVKIAALITEIAVIQTLIIATCSNIHFYDSFVKYPNSNDFPMAQTTVKYENIDYMAVIEGYENNGKFTEEKHIAIVTSSGNIIDLSNFTFYSADNYTENIRPKLSEKGIETKTFKTIEEIKPNKNTDSLKPIRDIAIEEQQSAT
ncbi:MAG: hypothetical protein KIG53_06650 [Oscillospiraceae bacterium]|nr:hypothetical protein [Oscillospiraceae bacterium]